MHSGKRKTGGGRHIVFIPQIHWSRKQGLNGEDEGGGWRKRRSGFE